MQTFFVASILGLIFLAEPSKLQLMEEAIDRVLMTSCVGYEKGQGLDGKLSDITITYTGMTTIDARQDSLVYYVYGNYTFSKYSYVRTPNILTGGTTGQAYTTSGSTTYVAKMKSVLDEYRVQEIVVVNKPDKFDFITMQFDSLKLASDWIYPSVRYHKK